MKLRIKGDSLRLRLTQTEVKELSTGIDVVSLTQLDPVSIFTVSLASWNLEVPSVELQNQTLQIQVPATHVGLWANSDDEGLELKMELIQGSCCGWKRILPVLHPAPTKQIIFRIRERPIQNADR
jgi:hypothetical protein